MKKNIILIVIAIFVFCLIPLDKSLAAGTDLGMPQQFNIQHQNDKRMHYYKWGGPDDPYFIQNQWGMNDGLNWYKSRDPEFNYEPAGFSRAAGNRYLFNIIKTDKTLVDGAIVLSNQTMRYDEIQNGDYSIDPDSGNLIKNSSTTSSTTSGTGSIGPQRTFPTISFTGLENPSKIENLSDLFSKYLPEIIAMVGGMIFLIALVYGGILYMTAAGNEEMIDKGKKTLTWAVIGLVIIAIAWAVVTWFESKAGAPSSSSTSSPTTTVKPTK